MAQAGLGLILLTLGIVIIVVGIVLGNARVVGAGTLTYIASEMV